MRAGGLAILTLDNRREVRDNGIVSATRKAIIGSYAGWTGIGVMILGPLWGFLAMGICRLVAGGAMADTLTFYLMVAGWLIMPVGILLALYRLAIRAILNQRQDRPGEG